MRPALVSAVCVAALIVAFVVDILTPQLFVSAILLDIPIVLGTLTRSSRFTIGLAVAASVANVVAGYVNGLGDSGRWNTFAIGDRVLAGLSIVLVAYLSRTVQRTALHAGRLEAQALRAQREALLAAAIERIRASLSLDLVLRAIARETTALFDVQSARFVLTERTNGVTLVAHAGSPEISVDETRPAPEAASVVQRAFADRDVVTLRRSDAFGRLVLDHLGAATALALPIADGERRFGVVLALGRSAESFEDTLPLARAYCAQAAGALGQARLFAELDERNAALAERGAVIRDLVYALSHDLRTPLAALGMTLRQAHAGAYGAMPEAYVPILDRSISATDDVARLAETLLLVARFESGDRRPEREPVELGALVRQLHGELEALATVAEVELHVEAGGEVHVRGDRADLRRALANLTANALAHTPGGGRVTLAVTRAGNMAQLSVTDDGFGVAETVRPHLFARFAGGNGRRGGGSGLGLYIVRRIARESGGDVQYAGRSPRGSVFTLELPAIDG